MDRFYIITNSDKDPNLKITGKITDYLKEHNRNCEVQQAESAAVVDKTFGGSLPQFVAAFLNAKPISGAEAAESRALLDAACQKEE